MDITDYYKNLTENQRVKFRAQVIELTQWSYPTFYNRMRKGYFTILEEKAIINLIKFNENVGKN